MKNKPKKDKKKPKHAGVMRNDLDGFMRVVGKKIYVRYKGKDIATKCNNTPAGWKLANEWWAVRLKELKAIEEGEKQAEDTILNIFNKFLEYKRKISKITQKTEQLYNSAFKNIFSNPNEVLSEINIRKQLDNFIKNTALTQNSINVYLIAITGFLNWASDDDNNYIPAKKYVKKYKQKGTKNIKQPYTVEEYKLLIEFFEVENKKEIYLLLQFLWNTGARVGETLKIKLTDLDLENNRIFVTNKIFKGKQEALLLIPEAVKIAEQAKELAILRDDNKLFRWKDTNYPNRMVVRAETKLAIKIEGRGLHGFRRAFATRLFRKQIPIHIIQEAMRHKKIDTTIESYKEFSQQEVIDEMTKKL